MKKTKIFYLIYLIVVIAIVNSCSPKSVNTEPENLKASSKSWIPFEGTETIIFENDTSELIFVGTGKYSYYENVRYMTDQSGLIGAQEDYYADMERQVLTFESTNSNYILCYSLERDMTEVGKWDIFRVSVGDDDYYKNEIKLVVYESDKYDKGELYKFRETITLSKKKFNKVYFWRQERRPMEMYCTKNHGIVGFKTATSKIYTLKEIKK